MTANDAPWRHGATALLLALFALVLVRTAWMHEDAYITFRSIDNFQNGYGLTWNVRERVQSYTHPLWMLLVTAVTSLSHEFFFTVCALSILLTLAALTLVATRCSASGAGLAVLVGLLFSRSFVDFSTSGLENPLSHLLLVLFFTSGRQRRPPLITFLLAALLVLSRQDLSLIVLPTLALVVHQERGWKLVRPLAFGFLPVVAWHLFSLVYYGFLFPNTAYAKLNTGLEAMPLAAQGLRYLENSWNLDPLTLSGTTLGLLVGLLLGAREERAAAVGVLLYLTYVVRIGGDCMSGRFLSAPLLVALLVLARVECLPRVRLTIAAATVILGLFSPSPPLLSGSDHGTDGAPTQDAHRIDDVRRQFYPSAGMLPVARHGGEPFHEWAEAGRAARSEAERNGPLLVVRKPIGFYGFYAGPEVHVVDVLALTEPLLARLPTRDVEDFYVGHYERALPTGYQETLLAEDDRFLDKKLGAYYQKLSLVIRGDLFDPERWIAIWKLNTGGYDSLRGYPYHRQLARAFYRADRGDLKGAVALMEQAVADEPDRAVAWYYLGRLQKRTGNPEAATAAFAQALALDPQLATATEGQ